ncbi:MULTISPECIES: bifunctional phosphoribosylaminoimidazolecarboxamide formyltransferase/IMP cyclohydrolase [unclassified Candidatus Frackibacter]|uniref:bifunctional phosphoribosylaminoimidazolecarboxamide formyltransferase/IMP cyclohydrolase n=1 Tax=unclassified Candidatus Frackibacter TaxID=2648818 RepID=UPI00088EB701|nr:MULTISPECIES: bifunctional phosphoribosylaminoimidazolecarboxamide formyltransferase/IMP cyclohydrolase [unclassified Candidatus Frackibacter]SDC44813.1 IMP cyclohydrolase /phosphoribosylaminoimidazolecarboxamide formyltransferase [Candidatus Frackibacter sp. WG11]SEM64805.1 IMP cyclohydrolase /phosphoribosylaminoimidazolecarboxamide formyltransferase [Candidatus Frackibacter sp. WG12]SFL67701.1 IMP cyclohydrolase /phosphoribosylaminoimidazolecarboxamide formyltransferase [Candidatus Frackiba
MSKVRYALISVSDKTGVVEFAQGLSELGVKIISTGGTGRKLREAGIEVINISQVTDYPEMMDGRVKTLHPAVHGGILAVRENDEHMEEIKEQGIKPIDLIVVNLYPFAETIAQEDATFGDAIENIDIGGPTMIRSAAKNHNDVGVIVNPKDYNRILNELKENELNLEVKTKLELAYKAFKHTAEYDHLIQNYLSKFVNGSSELPAVVRDRYEKVSDLRYGENPHQNAAFYEEAETTEPSITTAEQLHGKDLSFNNINDTNGALELVKEFSDKPAVAVIKHANPCGMARADSLAEAYKKAYAGDPTSAFGSIVALNRKVDIETAQEIAGPEKFVEVVIAPDFSEGALEILKERWEDVRLLKTGELFIDQNTKEKDMKKVVGGLLVQDRDIVQLDESELEVVTEREPTEEEMADLLFSWKVVKHVKSNAIVMAKDEQIVGVGAGQMSRVDAMIIAGRKAGERKEGAVVASDAFFPFKDAIKRAAETGIKAIIQPGGSIRDEEVIAAANKHDIAMVFTGRRHFKH